MGVFSQKIVPLLWATFHDDEHGSEWMPLALADKMCHGVIRVDANRPNVAPQ